MVSEGDGVAEKEGFMGGLQVSEAEIMELLNKHSKELAEHFDAVQILVTWDEDGITKAKHCGRGNWWARMGLARNFIERDNAEDAATIFSEKLNPPDDGENWKNP